MTLHSVDRAKQNARPAPQFEMRQTVSGNVARTQWQWVNVIIGAAAGKDPRLPKDTSAVLKAMAPAAQTGLEAAHLASKHPEATRRLGEQATGMEATLDELVCKRGLPIEMYYDDLSDPVGDSGVTLDSTIVLSIADPGIDEIIGGGYDDKITTGVIPDPAPDWREALPPANAFGDGHGLIGGEAVPINPQNQPPHDLQGEQQ